jgi:hypothetical protein
MQPCLFPSYSAHQIVEARGLRQAGKGNRSQLEIDRSYAQCYIEGLGPAYQRRTRHWRTKNNFRSTDPTWNQVSASETKRRDFYAELLFSVFANRSVANRRHSLSP